MEVVTRLPKICDGTPGVVEHGLFEPELVSLILVAGENGVERIPGAKRG